MDKTKFKAILTVAIIIVAGSLGVILTAFNFTGSSNHTYANGLIIDRGGWDADWYPVDNPDLSVKSSLSHLQSSGKVEIEWDGDAIISVDGKRNDETHTWGLWVISKGSNSYKFVQNAYDTIVSDYSVCTVAYSTGLSPVPGTDYLGTPIYGHSEIQRTVSLSPSITEMICCLGAVDTIVGSDSASNYPDEYNKRKAEGKITEVADFRSASLEKIMSVNPDMAFFDGSSTPLLDIAKRLMNETSIESIVLYPGWTSRQIMDNIFIVGTSLGDEYKDVTSAFLKKVKDSYLKLSEVTSAATEKRTGAVIMSDVGTTDWFAGKETCVRDYIVEMNGDYGFDSFEVTWDQLNLEQLVKINPDFIIVTSSTYRGQSGYEQLISDHRDGWQSLDAWKNGKIFLLYDQAGDITSRLGPRFIECCEIFAKYMYPELFDVKIQTNCLGDDYHDYLTFTKGVLH